MTDPDILGGGPVPGGGVCIVVDQHESDVDGRLRVRTADDFIAGLRQLRAQAGNPSFRELGRVAAARGDHRADPLPPSTTSEVLAGKRLPRLPRLEFVESYVAACKRSSGADEHTVAAEVARWRELWRSLMTEERPAEPAGPQPTPRRTLVLPLIVVIFVAGLGAGVTGSRWWPTGRQADQAGALPAAPDACVQPEAADLDGQDVFGPQRDPWWVDKPSVVKLEPDGRRFSAEVRAGTTVPGDLVIVKDVSIVKARSYALAFTTFADRDTKIRVRVQDSSSPGRPESYQRDIPVGPTPCRRVFRFPGELTSDQSEVTFQVGGRSEDFRLEVSDVQLVMESAGR